MHIQRSLCLGACDACKGLTDTESGTIKLCLKGMVSACRVYCLSEVSQTEVGSQRTPGKSHCHALYLMVFTSLLGPLNRVSSSGKVSLTEGLASPACNKSNFFSLLNKVLCAKSILSERYLNEGHCSAFGKQELGGAMASLQAQDSRENKSCKSLIGCHDRALTRAH